MAKEINLANLKMQLENQCQNQYLEERRKPSQASILFDTANRLCPFLRV
jgi:hypothetical protein